MLGQEFEPEPDVLAFAVRDWQGPESLRISSHFFDRNAPTGI